MNTAIDRDQAVKDIADRIADRDSFVITLPPANIPTVAKRLSRIPEWTAYIDNGTGAILRTTDAHVLTVIDLLIETAVILVVPKTVPAADLGRVVQSKVPADGSQDIVITTSRGVPYGIPLLFVDALAVVDPRFATALRMNSIPNLN